MLVTGVRPILQDVAPDRGSAPPRLTTLTLDITAACPLSCAHCCVDAGPGRTETMALEDALDWLDQAIAVEPRMELRFLGGEPFVRYPLMNAIATEAARAGITWAVTTSAVWAKTQAHAAKRLTTLKGNGLRMMYVSYDEFHRPWVDVEQIRNCVTAASKLGIRTVITRVATPGSGSISELLGDWYRELPGVHASEQPLGPNGRARSLPAPLLPIEDWGRFNLRCPARDELLIRWDGAAYLCATQTYLPPRPGAASPTAEDPATDDYLYLGDARQTPIRHLLAREQSNTWLQVIVDDGFNELERIVQKHHPGFVLPRTHAGVCHLCQLTFGHGELGDVVRDALLKESMASEREPSTVAGRGR